MDSILRIGSTAVGQAVWAVAQAAVILLLSKSGEHALIGIFMLGLAIFVPLCLLGSFNLRMAVSIDRDLAFSPRLVVSFRIVVVSLAYTITAALLFILSDSLDQWLAGTLLIGMRAADQLGDVVAGFYTRDDRQDLVARSFFLRGIANIAPFVILFQLTHDVIITAGFTSGIAIATVAFHDLRPMLRAAVPSVKRLLVPEMLQTLRKTAMTAPIPVLDSLHFCSFRYAIYFTASTELLGMVGVGQTLFVPFQLLSSAINFTYLPFASRVLPDANRNEVGRHLALGMLLGFSVSCLFLLSAFLLPQWLAAMLFGERAKDATSIVKMVALAMLAVTPSVFASSCLISLGQEKTYMLSPLVGILMFVCVGALLPLITNLNNLQIIAVAFLLSYCVRLVFICHATLKVDLPNPLSLPGASLTDPYSD